MLNAAIISAIEEFAPASLQETWDNTGVQVGSLRAECTGVLLCLDVTPTIVDEAIRRNCNLIISHHPLLFKGLKRISGNSPVEESVMRAIAAGVTIYSCHTSVDSTSGGVSYKMAQMLGANPMNVLSPIEGNKVRLSVTIGCDKALNALTIISDFAPDAACFKSERECYTTKQIADDPFGSTDISTFPISTIETIVDKAKVSKVYEELISAFGSDIAELTTEAVDTKDTRVGLGVYAIFDKAVSSMELIGRVKKAFSSPVARCSKLPDDDIQISRIAMCGGSGSEFISTAIRMGAQAFITSDTKYHDFVDFGEDILIIDIGHFESESCTKEIFYNVIRKKFPNFACYYSEIEENPIKYI